MVPAALLMAGCASRERDSPSRTEGSLLAALASLPSRPELRDHVLVADLGRLRAAYPTPGALDRALVGVWLPDAFAATERRDGDAMLGIELGQIDRIASAGFHPSLLTIADGSFTPETIAATAKASGYRDDGDHLARGADGAIDPSTPSGRLVLSALNRVRASTVRVTAASSSDLLRSLGAPEEVLADDPAFVQTAEALGPVTAAIILHPRLVRPPAGMVSAILPRHAADLVAVGIDDAGRGRRTLKVALRYSLADDAREDARAIGAQVAGTALPAHPGLRLADVADSWQVVTHGSVITITALLRPSSGSGTWRGLVESGDLAVLVRQQT